MNIGIKNLDTNSGLTIFFLVDQSLTNDSNNIVTALKYLKRRFNCKLAFGFSNLHALQSYQKALLTKESDLDLGIVSSAESTFYFDVLNYAKRFSTSNVIIVCSKDVWENFTQTLQFINRYLGDTRDLVYSIECRQLYCSTAYLRTLVLENLIYSFEGLCEFVCYKVQKSTNNKITKTPEIFFATSTGVERLGGVSKLATSKVSIDGKLLKDFESVGLIDDDCFTIDIQESSSSYSICRLPSVIDLNDSTLLFDLNPVRSFCTTNSQELNFQRTVLTIRRFDYCDSKELKRYCQRTAVFIMSNYNKVAYIHNTLFSIVMQLHHDIKIEIVDDASTDNSLEEIQKFQNLLTSPTLVSLTRHKYSMGTYWIRNSVIHKYMDDDSVYLVNDSDDYSSAQRARVQIAGLFKTKAFPNLLLFTDIVRVNSNYELLNVDGDIERYGTASLCSESRSHIKTGYYENLKKDADTEFIVRVKMFCKSHRVEWLRYPTLFQAFDGNNLTRDIYSLVNTATLDKLDSNRANHVAAFTNQHRRLDINGLPSHYRFPLSSIAKRYTESLEEYTLPNYKNCEYLFLVTSRDMYFQERKKWLGFFDYIVVHKELDLSVVVYDKEDNQSQYSFSLERSLKSFLKVKACEAWVYKCSDPNIDSIVELKKGIEKQIIDIKKNESVTNQNRTDIQFLESIVESRVGPND